MGQDYLHNIFGRGSIARTDSPVVSVGGVSSNSGTLTYDVLHFDTAGNLLISGGGPSSQSGSWTVQSLSFGQARTNDIAPAVTNGSNTPIITDSLGKQVVLQGAVNDQHVDGHVANIATTGSQTLIATPGVGRRIALQKIFVSASGSSFCQITISGGPANRTLGFLPPTGQINLNAGGAPLYITSASTVLLIVSNASTSFSAFASGYAMSN